jgi:serine-type D-Ala-D-Ala carboxypeptidase/endopeptidase (penicillin-binding protein 4)
MTLLALRRPLSPIARRLGVGRHFPGWVACLLAAGFSLGSGLAAAALPAALVGPLAEAGLPPEAVGLVVAPVAPGPRLVEHQAQLPLQPGSTMKLVTTLVGLEQLGPSWRGRTRLLAAGPIRGGVLQGDLVLQGGGDMDLTWPAVQGLLQQARRRGLTEIRGALVLDRSAFQPTRLDVGVPPFDEGPEFAYNVIPDALLVNGNLLRLELSVGNQGLQIQPMTPLAGLRVSHEMTLVEGDCAGWDDGWVPPVVRPEGLLRQMEVVLRGTWPAGCDRAVELNVIERDEFVGRLVRALWSDLGGTWRGKVREGVAPAGATLLAEHASRPLSELVRAINKPSDNAFTRTLMLAIGQAEPGQPGEPTLQRADRAMRRWLREHGIDDAGLVLDNGSGLSRSERISAAQLEGVVRAGLASRWAPEFMASLPIVGVDGTMRRRLLDSPAAGQARLKTGTLRNVVAVAGTVRDAAGQPLVVVALFNHDALKPRAMRPVIDRLIDWVARTRFEPAVPGR